MARRLIDLPGVRDLENAMVLHLRVRGPAGELNDRFDEVSKRLFGTTQAEALPQEPEVDEDDDQAVWDAYDALLTKIMDPDWAALGWDVRDDLGRELLVLPHFSMQLAAAALGAAGQLPSEDQPVEPAKLEASLAAEARAWSTKRQRRS